MEALIENKFESELLNEATIAKTLVTKWDKLLKEETAPKLSNDDLPVS